MTKENWKKTGRIILRVVLWTAGSIFLLLVLVSVAIQIPSVQQYIKEKAVTFLSDKIGTKVGLDRIRLSIPKEVILEGIYFEDQQQDTLLYTGRLAIDTDLFALINKRIELNSIFIEDLHANVLRTTGGVFNFDYIIDAFSDSTAAPKDTTQQAWQFSIEDIELSKIRISYDDSSTGDDLELSLATLQVNFDEFDLEQSHIYVDKFLLSDVNTRLVQGLVPRSADQPSLNDEKPTGENAFDFKIREIDLEKINVVYSQLYDKYEANLNLGKARLVADNIDMESRKIELDEFSLDDTFIAYHILQSANSAPAKVDSTEADDNGAPWLFSLSEINLSNNSFQFHDFNKPKISSGMDFSHLWISNFDFFARDVAVSESKYTIEITRSSLHERSGFILKDMHGKVSLNEQTADIKDFVIQTGASKIDLDVHSEYASLKTLSETYHDARVEATLEKSYLGLADLNYFIPDWESTMPLKISSYSDVHLDTKIRGKLNDLRIDQLEISALKETRLLTTGKLTGLPDMEKFFFDIHLEEFHTTLNDISSVLPDTMLPESVQIPNWIDLAGNFSGTLKRPSTKSILNTTFGSVQMDVKTNLNTKIPEYEGTLSVNEFALDQLLKNTTFGLLDVDIAVKGAGLTKENHSAQFDIDMNAFEFKDYMYKDLIVDGKVKDYLFTGKAHMKDPNLEFNLEGDLDYGFSDTRPYHFSFDLVNADFRALNLTARPLKARFSLDVDLDNANPDDLNGELKLHSVAVYNGDKLYKLDSLLFASLHNDEKTVLSLRSSIVNGKISGSFDLARIPDVMKNYFAAYYSLNSTEYYPTGRPQQFDFDLQINSTAFLTEVLVPDLTRFVPGEIKGDFNSEEKKLNMSLNIDEIEYGNISASGISFLVKSDENRMDYQFKTGQVSVSKVNIPSMQLAGKVEENTMGSELVVYDSLEKDRYVLGAEFSATETGVKIHLDPGKVVLDYQPWDVPEDNFITIDKGISEAEFSLANAEQKIEVMAHGGEQSSAQISFHQLKLGTLAHMALSQDTLISGAINGTIKLTESNKDQLLNADVTINDVVLAESVLGDVHLIAKQPTPVDYDFNVTVRGPATELDITGDYNAKDSIPEANVEARISSLDLAAIEPMLFGQAREMKGNVTGYMKVSGKTNAPVIDGRLSFKDVSLIPTYINTKVLLENESIQFNEKEIMFSNFTIKDNRNNPLTLNGKIGLENSQDYKLNLTARAKNFLMLDTQEGANDLFFGKLSMNAEVKVSGTSNHPEIDAQVQVGDESDFTYIVPQDEQGVMDQKGVVVFKDRDVSKDAFLASIEKEAHSRKDSVAFIQGITLSAKIELDDKETLHILIDPITGDKLTVKGNSTLTLDIDPTGNMDLTGRYELTSGSYGITFYKLVKRDFEIEKGSTITWTGDPMDAALAITGIYKVETSPSELLQNQSDSEEQSKQMLPFLVYLKVGGKILTPEISFALDMPESDRNALGGSVYAKLQDINTRESDLNKQVFSLLILKRFVGEDPFAAEGAPMEAVARTSVSRFLTDQLNQMSSKVKGVQLTFDVKSYQNQTEGGAENSTQLELGVSKNLFSDRLVVKLTGNVDLEGNQQGNQNFSDYIGDLALEYKLTEDGRLRVTGFYNSDYDMIDGELKEAGTGLIYVKDYDTLRELFKANDKTKE